MFHYISRYIKLLVCYVNRLKLPDIILGASRLMRMAVDSAISQYAVYCHSKTKQYGNFGINIQS